MRWLITTLLALGLTGCAGDKKTVRIGMKGFTEQAILAETLAALAREEGYEATVVRCGDTSGCQAALQAGTIDAMVDYTGTGLVFVGAPAPDRAAPVEQVSRLYEPLGVTWSSPLGFDNGYQLVTTARRARDRGWAQLSDLAHVEGGVRLAVPDEYRMRPGDGLGGLVSHYGLRMAADVVIADNPHARYQAVISGRVDVAVAYATDGSLEGLGLVPLTDDLDFFGEYAAAIVTRSARADLVTLFAALEGQITTTAMREANYAVAVAGRTPSLVAHELLAARELVSTDSGPAQKTAAIKVVRFADHDLAVAAAAATRAVHAVFPARRVSVTEHANPIDEVARGRARLALISAARFFDDNGKVDVRVEACAVVQERLLHVIRKAGADGSGPLIGRIGAPLDGTAGALTAHRVLAQNGMKATRQGAIDELLRAIRAGELDGALIVAAAGQPELLDGLAAGDLKVAPLGAWLTPERARALPWLRHARLPQSTYAGQGAPIATLSSQVVLAGPSRAHFAANAPAGPAGSVPNVGRPLSTAQVRALAGASAVPEVPNPALPSAWTVAPTVPGSGPTASSAAWLDTLLNVLCIAFLLWVGRMATQPLDSTQA